MSDQPIDWLIAPDDEMAARQNFATEVFEAIFHPEAQPIYVSDETRLDDLNTEPEEEVEARIRIRYGLQMTKKIWGLAVWKFLDLLKLHLDRQAARGRVQ